jgi:molybdate transport system substrate-binding protein
MEDWVDVSILKWRDFMKNLKKKISIVLLVVTTLCMLTINTSALSTAPKATPVTITVSAAASLQDAMVEIAKEYAKEKPNVKVTFNFGASGTLQKQIEQGAPVDLFLSAGKKQMDALKSQNLLDNNTLKTLLFNDVVLIVPKDSKLVLKGFSDLTGSKVKKVAMGEPKSVPAGQYGEEILTFYKILDAVKAKTVYGNDVRGVLTWVEDGNADAGIVYKTDALISSEVRIIATASAETHSPVVYPAAVLKSAKYHYTAGVFLNYLSGKKAMDIFKKYGFRTE